MIYSFQSLYKKKNTFTKKKEFINLFKYIEKITILLID